ncbi:MAG TPA: DHA2 family efflux MFS transporter permease subunit [Candidatus Polarisedimenticolia bacterium]|nr:DHA2 family efflux MFS transporter permease subunit [Candidatus Polarisedimenticolia bacterium]
MATSISPGTFLERPEVAKWLIAIAVMASAMMELVDTAAVNVSLPYIAGNLSATTAEATWVLTSYLVSNAIVLPLSGWLANYFGRKRLLIMAVTGFTGASVLCGLAPTLPLLICFRVLQGVSGGSLQPTTRAIMLETFPREQRGHAMAFFGVGIVVAPILAPMLGGWLTTDYSWRWIFFINVPVCAVGLIMLQLFVHDPPYIRRGTLRMDYWGLGMLVTGIAALQVMLDKGQEDDWFSSHFIVTLSVTAVVCLTAFVIWELRSAEPLVHFRLLKLRTFAAGTSLSAILGFVLFGSVVLIPLFMQELLGFPAITAGFWNAPRGIATMLLMPVAGILIERRWDMRGMIFSGLLSAALGVFLFSFLDSSAGPMNFVWPQIVMGAGLAFTFVPLATISVDPIPSEEMGYATGIIALMRNLGGSIGISVVATVLARGRQARQTRLAAHVTPFAVSVRSMIAAMGAYFSRHGAGPAEAGRDALALIYRLTLQQVATLSYMDAFRLLGILFFVVSPIPWVMRRHRVVSEPSPSSAAHQDSHAARASQSS